MTANRWRIGAGSDNDSSQPYAKHDTKGGTGWSLHLPGSLGGSLVRIAPGTGVIPDWLSQLGGPLSLGVPPDFSLLRPIDQPMLDVPEGYQDGTQLNLLFQGHPLTPLSNTSEYVGSMLFALHWLYTQAPEAEAGMLQIYIVEKPEVIFSSKRMCNFYKPVWTPTGRWVERSDSIFGPAVLAPPRPKLFVDMATAALPDVEPEAASDPAADALFAEISTPAPVPVRPVAPTTPVVATPATPISQARAVLSRSPAPAPATAQSTPRRSTGAATPKVLPPVP